MLAHQLVMYRGQTITYLFDDSLISHRDTHTMNHKHATSITVAPPIKKSVKGEGKKRCKFSCSYNEDTILDSSKPQGTIVVKRKLQFMLPVVTISEINSNEPWRVKHARHKIQKGAVIVYFRESMLVECKNIRFKKINLPCEIKLTRFAPRKLDEHDNLRISVKYILDQLCAEITGEHRPGIADSFEGFTFLYAQEVSKDYGVKVEISY